MPSNAASLALQAIQLPFTLLATLGIDGVNYPTQTKLENNTFYDYIVVGGGSAGSVVATRLAEDKNHTVLVLEAGYSPPINVLLPPFFVTLPKSKYDYDYSSTFDPYAAGGQGNRTALTAGKMLGGCDSLNHFIHGRGCPDDFDEWAKITNDDSWRYENFLKYFIKSERIDDTEIVNTYPEYHGTDGPMGLSRQLETDKLEEYLKSFAQAGQPSVLDLTADTFVGYMQPLYMLADGIRQTPAKSYLGKVKDYTNLHVSTETLVARVLFEANVAVAVEAIYKGKTYIINAKKEIIICAGALRSPQILMLSGVGPKDHLEEMNINVIADLPVGNNYIDQVAATILYKTKKYLLPIPNPLDAIPIPTKIPFPVLLGAAALNESQKCPDYQVFSLLFPHDTPYVTLACHNAFLYRSDICDSWQKQVIGRDTLYNFCTNLNPKSKGTIRLNSTNPLDYPLITTNFFKDPIDLDNMIKYVMNFIKVGNTDFFKEVGAELVGVDLPECKDEVPLSYEFWKCYILNRATSGFHYAGTCAMGSVVDGTLSLIGFKRIRVIDASVMPVIPKAPPNGAIIAIAEKGADMIKSTSCN